MQSDFAHAVLDPALPPPDGIASPTGHAPARRFDIYRNNVVASLCDALEVGFPVLRKLLGAEFFRAMAGVYLRAHPPRSPVLSLYGDAMPGFLVGFGPVAHLPYLPDIARLELALRRAYHAADPPAFDATVLAGMSPDRLSRTRLRLVSAVHVVVSDHPVHAIWLANTAPDAPRPTAGAQAALISRPGFDPCADPLTPDAGRFVIALLDGAALADAVESAHRTSPDFDPTSTLALLVRRLAICGLTERDLP